MIKMSNEEIYSCIENVKNGDEKSLEQIYENYELMIKNIAKKYYIPGEDKEDVIQYIRIGMYKAIKTFKQDKSSDPKAFFIMCIKSYMKDIIKRANRNKRKILSDSLSLEVPIPSLQNENIYFADIVADDFSIEKHLEFKEFKDYFENEICLSLGKLSREVFQLYLEGLSYSEIAQKLNITNKQVDNAMQRARRNFKNNVQLNELRYNG